MTRTSSLSLASLGMFVLAGLGACSDDAPPSPNPSRLWLALDGRETEVRLVPVEPPPF